MTSDYEVCIYTPPFRPNEPKVLMGQRSLRLVTFRARGPDTETPHPTKTTGGPCRHGVAVFGLLKVLDRYLLDNMDFDVSSTGLGS